MNSFSVFVQTDRYTHS